MADDGNTEAARRLRGGMTSTLLSISRIAGSAFPLVATLPPPTPRCTPNPIHNGAPPKLPSGVIAAARAIPRPPTRTPSQANGPGVFSQTASASNRVLPPTAPDAPLLRDPGRSPAPRIVRPLAPVAPRPPPLPGHHLSDANGSRCPAPVRSVAQRYRMSHF
jgi:hypothetical protein